jgi:hypothetical protein
LGSLGYTLPFIHFDQPPVRCRFLAVRDAWIRMVLVMIASVLLVTGCKNNSNHATPLSTPRHKQEPSNAGGCLVYSDLMPLTYETGTIWIRTKSVGGSHSMIQFCIACNPIAKSRKRNYPLGLVQAGGHIPVSAVRPCSADHNLHRQRETPYAYARPAYAMAHPEIDKEGPRSAALLYWR